MPELCQTSAFYIPAASISGAESVVFDPGESAHIARVLRLTAGDAVDALDGRGGVYRVELTAVRPSRVEGRVIESRAEPEPLPEISVTLAVGRKERLRFAVEKLTELGCHRIWPLDCENLQFPGRLGSQVKKLEAAAVAALKQSRRLYLTRIEQPVSLQALLNLCAKENLAPVFCQPGGPEFRSLESWAAETPRDREYVLVVGPEGGFSARESAAIEKSGHISLDLGGCWLRSETAALAGFTLLVQYLRHEFSVSGWGNANK